MLTREEDAAAHALRRQGWTISAIARHLGRDRKTIRAYLNGERTPGERREGRTRSSRSWPTAANAWPTIRICGPRPCSMR
ncbi:terminase gpP N-terminus-related DNA-binding protein [Streptomyces sp. XY332]|uniref:terminase gpP N-terminus-related DNA-binding protein n=1 Tax=Streptomyces sp. XY332 TaxID=1415561 RepID=UPI003B63DD05